MKSVILYDNEIGSVKDDIKRLEYAEKGTLKIAQWSECVMLLWEIVQQARNWKADLWLKALIR